MSLKFIDHHTQQHFVLKNVPLLVEIYTGGYTPLMEVTFKSSGIISQLEKFRFGIDFNVEVIKNEMMFFSGYKSACGIN